MSAQSEEADDSPSCNQPSAMLEQSLDEAGQRQTCSWDLHRGSQASVMLYFMTCQVPSCVNKERKKVYLDVQSQECQVDTIQGNAEEAAYWPCTTSSCRQQLAWQDKAAQAQRCTTQHSTAQHNTTTTQHNHNITQHSTAQHSTHSLAKPGPARPSPAQQYHVGGQHPKTG